METLHRTTIGQGYSLEFGRRNTEFFLRVLLSPLSGPPVYITHEIPITRESLASLTSPHPIILRLPPLELRYGDKLAYLVEDGRCLCMGQKAWLMIRARDVLEA